MGKLEGCGLRLIEALPEDGERRLMLAVLMDAIRIIRQRTGGFACRGNHEWLQELAWLRSDEHRRPFSFVAICHALGIDPEYVRRCVTSHASEPLPMNGRRYSASTQGSWEQLRRPRRLRSTHGRTPKPAQGQAAIPLESPPANEELTVEEAWFPLYGTC